MTLMSVCYMALTYTLTSLLGPVGMVLANCANMVVRIVFAVRVIQKTYEDQPINPLKSLVPDTDVLLLLLSAGVTCFLSEIYLYSWSAVVHLLLGAAIFLMVIISIVIKEDYIIMFIKQKITNKFGPREEIKKEE